MTHNNITSIFICFAAAATLALLAACGERDYTKDSPFDNVVYIDAARVKELNQFTFNNVTETGSRTLAATLAFPAEQDVNVSIGADPSLVSLYSSRLGEAIPPSTPSTTPFRPPRWSSPPATPPRSPSPWTSTP